MIDKETQVVFINEKLKKLFNDLKSKNFEEEQLFYFLNRGFEDLKENPFCGVRIPKKLWPKEYVQKYQINNLWKYNLPNAWRLVYTIEFSKIKIVNIILEWFNHKEYNRRFRYN